MQFVGAQLPDLVALWPRTAVASAAQAVALHYGASPLAGEGPFLAAYVADLTGAPEHVKPAPS